MSVPALRRLVPLAALLAAALASGPALTPRPRDLPGERVYTRALEGVVWVQSAERARGSGWVADRGKRWVVTCYHVVGEGDTAEVTFPLRRDGAVVADRALYLEQRARLEKDGLVVRGKVLRRNPQTDLALIELPTLPAGVEALPLARDSARPGDRVFVVGNRYDLDVLWASGSGSVRQVQVLREGYFHAGKQLANGAPVLLAGVPINEGDSGGPLLNGRGEVVGVSAAVAWEAQGAGLFIDTSAVRDLLEVREKGKPEVVEDPVRRIYEEALRSVAVVHYEGGGRASGLLLDRARRLVLTTAEGVSKEKTVEVSFPVWQSGRVVAEAAFYRRERDALRRKGALATGTVLAVNLRRNLALLEVERLPEGVKEAVPVEESVSPGQRLHLVTSPNKVEVLWLYGSASVRQLASAHLGQTTEGKPPPVILLQAPLAEGEGGGPVLDGKGRLVGVVSGKVGPQQQVAFALPAAEVRAFLREARPLAEPWTPAELCARARKFLQARRFDEAVRDFSRAIELDGKYAPAHAGRAWARYLTGEPEKGLPDAEKAVTLEPRSALAHAYRGAILLALGKGKAALADADKAVALDGKLSVAREVRALARLTSGDVDGALADAGEGLWLDRQDAFGYEVRGRAYLRKAEPSKAVADLAHALTLEPGRVDLLRLRAEAHWAANDTGAALEDWQECLKRNGRDARALLGRARVRAAGGEPDAALKDLEACLAIAPGLAEAYRERGSLRVKRGAVKAGADDFLEALRRGRPGKEVLDEVDRRAAELLVDRDDPAACVLLCRRVLEGLPALLTRDGELRKKLAEELARAGKGADDKARARALREVLELARARWPG